MRAEKTFSKSHASHSSSQHSVLETLPIFATDLRDQTEKQSRYSPPFGYDSVATCGLFHAKQNLQQEKLFYQPALCDWPMGPGGRAGLPAQGEMALLIMINRWFSIFKMRLTLKLPRSYPWSSYLNWSGVGFKEPGAFKSPPGDSATDQGSWPSPINRN